jgi:trk system potassium uptake protein TrkA
MKVIIVGGGKIGSYVADLLIKQDCDVTIIEKRPEVLKKLRKSHGPEVILEGDGTDPTALMKAGITTTDVVVAVSGEDEVNLVASTIAKYEYSVDRVIARVNNPKNEWLFTLEMGVDVKVNQAKLLSRLVVDEIDMRNIFTLMKLNRGNYSIIQMSVHGGSKADGGLIKDLDVSEKFVFIAITRNHEVIIPKGDTKLQAGDQIMALSDESSQLAMSKMLG